MKIKNLFTSLLIITFLTFTAKNQAFAQMGSMMNDADEQKTQINQTNEQHQTIDVVLKNLLDKYQVSKIQNLDCKKITDDEFEQVGETQMEVMHPGEAHEAMDQMMGGEGSDSLKSMHIRMGQNYLGCQNDSDYNHDMMGGIGMMGSGMMGNGFANSYKSNRQFAGNHMGWADNGYNNFSFAPMLMMTGFWLLVILGIVAIFVWVKKQNNPNTQNSQLSAIEIAKIRYAKGEINKKQFDDLKKDLA